MSFLKLIYSCEILVTTKILLQGLQWLHNSSNGMCCWQYCLQILLYMKLLLNRYFLYLVQISEATGPNDFKLQLIRNLE